MKKRVLSILCAGLIALSAAGCSSSGTSKEEHQSLLDENSALQAQVDELEAKLAATPEPSPDFNMEDATFMGARFSVPEGCTATPDDSGNIMYYYPSGSQTTMIMVSAQPVDNSSGDYSLSDTSNRDNYIEGVASSLDNYQAVTTSSQVLDDKVGFFHTCECDISGINMNFRFAAVTLPDMVFSFSLVCPTDLPEEEASTLLAQFETTLNSVDFSQAQYASSTPAPALTSETSSVDTHTAEQSAALSKALDYLDYTAFSRSGLVDQLEYEGFSTEDATWAVDNCGADWNQQALQTAKDYLDYTAFSYTGLIDQLEYEGFTMEQAAYGVDNCGANWMEQAVLCAQDYLDYTSFSRQGLIDQLLYEGFTQEQAEYGAAQAGL